VPDAKPKRTPEEQAIIDVVAEREGREWADRHAYLILEQARALGELDEEPEPDVVVGDGDQGDTSARTLSCRDHVPINQRCKVDDDHQEQLHAEDHD
jgi:hypothetical protein